MQPLSRRLFLAFTAVSALAGCSVSNRNFENGMKDPSQKGIYVCENSDLKSSVSFDSKNAALVSGTFGTGLLVTDLATNNRVKIEANADWRCGLLSNLK